MEGGEVSVTGCAAPEGGHSYRSPGGRGRGPGCRGRGQSIRHAEYFFSGCRHFHALRGGAGPGGGTLARTAVMDGGTRLDTNIHTSYSYQHNTATNTQNIATYTQHCATNTQHSALQNLRHDFFSESIGADN